MTLRQSKTTHNLLNSLAAMKQRRESLSNRLSADINRNNEVLEEQVVFSKRNSQKMMVQREKAIDKFQSKMKGKEEADFRSKVELEAVAFRHEKRKDQLERRLEEMGKRNEQRIMQLKTIQSGVMDKINGDLKRNEVREKHLLKEYQRIKKEEKKISGANLQQRKEELRQWGVLQNQRLKLQVLAREGQQKQGQLVTGRDPQPVKREEKRKDGEKGTDNQKDKEKESRKKGLNTMDAKEMGRRYMQQAKGVQRQTLAINKKKRLLNVNLKVINYDKEIMDRIYRNTSDLSAVVKPPAAVSKYNESKVSSPREGSPVAANEDENDLEIESNLRSDFLMAEDLTTQRYLRKIKGNLEELSRINAPKMQNPEQQAVPSLSESEQGLLVPATLVNQPDSGQVI